MELKISELLELQALDTRIGKLRREQEALDHGERVERALALRRARLEIAERKLQGLTVEQRDAELEQQALETKKHGVSRRLYEGRVTAPRELQALEMEVAMLERQRQRLDRDMMARQEAEKALRVIRRRYQKETERISEELARLEPERQRLAARLEPDVLRRYDEIRRRSANLAAVRVENGACAGCRMKVGTALLRRVNAQDTYVYCESCSRFLFPAAEG
jgi:predicted  nucleic acid-binding Zn-ribbon protein